MKRFPEKIMHKIIIKLLLINTLLISAESVLAGRYIKVSNSGQSLPESASLGFGADDWACTYDSENKLLWEVKTDNGGLRNKDWHYTWYDSSPEALVNGGSGEKNGPNSNQCDQDSFCNTDDYEQRVNRDGLCGVNDWTLPSGDELKTLVYCLEGNPSTWIGWDERCTTQNRPTIDQDYFPNTIYLPFFHTYWTSTSNLSS